MWDHDHDQPLERKTQNVSSRSSKVLTLEQKIKILRDEIGISESDDLDAVVDEAVDTLGLASDTEGLSLIDKVHRCLHELGRDQIRKTRLTAAF